MSNTAAKITETYRTISDRLFARFNPGIHIEDHIAADSLDAGRTTLDGITFVAKDYYRLLAALRNTRDLGGEKAFAEGSLHDRRHWALQKSFSETHGIGFREIWRPQLSDRPLSMADVRPSRFAPQPDDGLSAKFGNSPDQPDFSSVHCGIAKDICNIHIDEMGFVMTGPTGEVVVDPDAFQHIVNELWWKTKAKGHVPLWLIDRLDVIVPSSLNNYSRLGMSFDVVQSKSYKVTLTGTCSVLGDMECAGALTFSGTHDIGGRR